MAAQATGLVMSGVSLAAAAAGTFTSIVQCFEYVELSRRFGKDFRKSQARFDALKLQLTRWGISAGILVDPFTGTCRYIKVDAEIKELAERLLQSILEDSEEIRRKSKKYRDKHASSPSDLEVFHETDMDSQTLALTANVQRIYEKRTKGISWVKKTKWAVYEKKLFDRLLDDIGENLGNLESLCKPIIDYQRQIVQIEVEEIQSDGATGTLELLRDASDANNDTMLRQAVASAIAARGSGHKWVKTDVSDTVKLEQGDRIGNNYTGYAPAGRIGHNYGETIGRGGSQIKQGDAYGDI
ncbi:hypothetical protein FPHYL_11254 [Fusarium phyllophilum]|uniref:Prion-inhibition and propagation HeLo domain-containing protein n=1 Tax=Fusarium phyllophilum TaxID=47803 RepID=A0A8H5IUK5_9HYPO|nr:hypothetical protein FPHYL_11254 [Fusarium phyllophilum]